jgi:signal transduction histidine kinase
VSSAIEQASDGRTVVTSDVDAWAEVDRLWLDTLGRVAARGAHEVKGALNGVSVNLEVVRSRAERPDAPASSVQRFAESAAQQLEGLIRMSDALLSLARPVREPMDLPAMLTRLAALLGPSTAAEGGRLELAIGDREAATGVRGNAARLGVAAALLAALERKGVTTCRLEAGEEIVIRVHTSAGGAIVVPPAVTQALAAVGVRTDAEDAGCALTFPRAGGTTPEQGTETA